jgi:hypothetical protein
LRDKKLDPLVVQNDLSVECCKQQHLAALQPHTKVLQVLHVRKKYWGLPRQKQDQYLLDTFNNAGADKRQKIQTYQFCGVPLCSKGFQRALGISNKKHWHILQHLRNGAFRILPPHREQGPNNSEILIQWLRTYVHQHGDIMPDSTKIQLPPTSLLEIHSHYIARAAANGDKYIQYSYFTRVFGTHFTHVTIPRYKRFSKCARCLYLRIRQEGTMDAEIIAKCKQDKWDHAEKYLREKRKYYKHRQKSRSIGKTLCVFIDAMDQSKTMLPRFTRQPGGTERLTRLKTHLVGVLAHEKDKKAAVYNCTDLWAHDSNLSVECLMRALLLCSKPLPKVLQLQFDNCWRENKNQKVFGFLAYLVQKEVFTKVRRALILTVNTSSI